MPVPAGRSQPGVKRYLHWLVVAIVLCLAGLFLLYIGRMERDIERTSINKQVNDINAYLALKAYSYITKGRLQELQDYQYGNPFELMHEQDRKGLNYRGEVGALTESLSDGAWYFVSSNQVLMYRSTYGQGDFKYQLHFSFEDTDRSGRFEVSQDKFNSFSLVPK